ncbi:MAG TPA: ParA family protein [Devosia sp.]|nr:ParA family protein [Devosia sp.]
MQFIDEVWILLGEKSEQWVAYLFVAVAGILAWIIFRLVVRWGQQVLCFLRSRQRTLKAIGREVSRDGNREGNGVWLTKPIHQPDDYETRIGALRVLAIANLKGGVGKTTLTANLGAYFARDRGLRVLLVDLDFQGSLSSMAFPDGGWIPQQRQSSIATRVISNDLSPDLLPELAHTVDLGNGANRTGKLEVVTAYYDLAQADNRIMVEWLLKCRPRVSKGIRQAVADVILGKAFRTDDVRYTLAEMLHSKPVRNAYDLVIIDCPPRLTTSEIQAFCAASHLLIPTIMDRPSAEAVVSLCRQVETLKQAGICPHLKYVGVVGTMWQEGRLANGPAVQQITDALHSAAPAVSVLDEQTFVRRATALVNDADTGIAYIVMNAVNGFAVRQAIEALANEVAARMGLAMLPNYRNPGR